MNTWIDVCPECGEPIPKSGWSSGIASCSGDVHVKRNGEMIKCTWRGAYPARKEQLLTEKARS